MIRNFGLDLLRAISIWLVLLQHAGINIHGLQPLKIGGIGVEIFFVISGYLIGGILLNEIAKDNSLAVTLKRFWARRWMRILPLYYLVLAVKFSLDPSIGWNLIYYVFFLQNNFYGIEFLEVSWSLVIEEWFYIFSPLFLFHSIRSLKKSNRVVMAIVLFIAVVGLARFSYVLIYDVPYEGVNGNAPFRFDSLFIGVLLSYVELKYSQFFRLLANFKIFLLGLLLFTGYIYYYWLLSYPDNLINQSLFPRTIGFLVLPLSIGLTLPYIVSLNDIKINRFVVRFITLTSVLTYGIYLIHPFVYQYILQGDLFTSYQFSFAISILITYGLSYLAYRYYEKPILRIRDYLVPREQKE